VEITRLDGLRFEIEHSFKQAMHLIGTFAYHFWMRNTKPLRRGNGHQYLHRESPAYHDAVKRKVHRYHVVMQAGVVCQTQSLYAEQHEHYAALVARLSSKAGNAIPREFARAHTAVDKCALGMIPG
jgi:hypothetical protein